MAKKSYYTKAELLDFARHCHSDERRFKLQLECRDKIQKGMVNPIPWSIAERQVTEDDFKEWKNKREEA